MNAATTPTREAMRRDLRQKIGAHLYRRAKAIRAELADLCPYAHRYYVATARGHLNEVEKLRGEIAAMIDGAFCEKQPGKSAAGGHAGQHHAAASGRNREERQRVSKNQIDPETM